LVVYHNKHAATRGWIKHSAASMDKATGRLVQKTLSEALSLPNDAYAIFKDYVTGLEYIRSCHELKYTGLFVELGSYQCHVFLDWYFVTGEQWAKLNRVLGGSGITSVQNKFSELFAAREEVKEDPLRKRTMTRKVLGKTAALKPPRKSTGTKLAKKVDAGTVKKKSS